MKMRGFIFKKFIILAAIVGLALYFGRGRLRIFWYEAGRPELPEAQVIQEKGEKKGEEGNEGKLTNAEDDKEKGKSKKENADVMAPEEYNLAVPFASQAPFADWGEPYQEACEEAALIMVARYFSGQTLTPAAMDEEIKKLVAWQKDRFGYYEDTTAAEVAQIGREYFNLNAELDYDVSVDNIKKYLSQNKLVLVPAAGRILPNPYFRGEGPLYHMLVIRGYTKDRFITNDPGTKRGEGFVYKYYDLINAIHDWPRPTGGSKSDVTAEQMLSGQKVMIVVSKK